MQLYCSLLFVLGTWCLSSMAVPSPAKPLQFRVQEVDRTLKVGYSVIVADVDNDMKPDIVVADAQRVIWLQNPGWKLHTIIAGQTKPDNVSIAAHDIDGDGLVDFALAADWKPFNTRSGGTLQWLKRGKTLDEPWTVHSIAEDIPTIHRIRFATLSPSKAPHLIVVPLMGRGASAAKNWSEQPVEILSYAIPRQPLKDRWTPTTLDHSLHVIHNFHAVDVEGGGNVDLLSASYEGVSLLKRRDDRKTIHRLGLGDQTLPEKNRGASEVRLGRLKNGQPAIATIEPWHGSQVVVYRPSGKDLEMPWQRTVIDKDLKWGHAVAWADLNGDGQDELIVGVRDNLSPQHPCGIRLYRLKDDGLWMTERLDPGGVAVEDLTVADLNGDGKPDIIAVGRATGNVRIYWNEN